MDTTSPTSATGHRGAARTAGALLIAGVLTSIAGTAILADTLAGPDVLASVAAHGDRVIAAAVLQLLTAVGAAGIALALYPAIRSAGPGLALAAVVARGIEAVFAAGAALALLVLLGIAGPAGPGSDQLVALVTTTRDGSTYVLGVVFFGLGATAYLVLLLRTRLLPGPLLVWGLTGVALIVVTALATVVDGAPFAITGWLAVLAAPIAVQELVMGGWLLVRGFGPGSSRLPRTMTRRLRRRSARISPRRFRGCR